MASRLPGPRGPLPFLRTAYGMQFRPVDTVVDLHDRYRPIVEFGMRPFRYTIVYGDVANKLILADRADAFTLGRGVRDARSGRRRDGPRRE